MWVKAYNCTAVRNIIYLYKWSLKYSKIKVSTVYKMNKNTFKIKLQTKPQKKGTCSLKFITWSIKQSETEIWMLILSHNATDLQFLLAFIKWIFTDFCSFAFFLCFVICFALFTAVNKIISPNWRKQSYNIFHILKTLCICKTHKKCTNMMVLHSKTVKVLRLPSSG